MAGLLNMSFPSLLAAMGSYPCFNNPKESFYIGVNCFLKPPLEPPKAHHLTMDSGVRSGRPGGKHGNTQTDAHSQALQSLQPSTVSLHYFISLIFFSVLFKIFSM